MDTIQILSIFFRQNSQKMMRLQTCIRRMSNKSGVLLNEGVTSDFKVSPFTIPKPLRDISEDLEHKRKRLVWSSRKRGILETDLLLSTFTANNINKMTSVQLTEYDSFLEENDWDIYYWLTGAKELPKQWNDSELVQNLIIHSKNNDKKILKMPDLS